MESGTSGRNGVYDGYIEILQVTHLQWIWEIAGVLQGQPGAGRKLSETNKF